MNPGSFAQQLLVIELEELVFLTLFNQRSHIVQTHLYEEEIISM